MPALAVTTRPHRPTSALQVPFPHADLAPPSDALAPDANSVAIAYRLFGEPGPMVLLRQDGALRILGWSLGSGRAECRQEGRLAQLVGIDVVLIGDGRYAVSERIATEGKDGYSRLEAWCALCDSPAEVRRHCEDGGGDDTRAAARLAALDHATRCWPPFRNGSARFGDVLPFPFALD
jgi:hypothetical protein